MAKAKNKSSTKSRVRRGAAPNKARLEALANGARLKKVGDKEFDLSDYQAVKSAGGNSSLDNGDTLAKQWRALDLDEVYKRFGKIAGRDMAEAMRKRYAKLNPGMQRMNLGNRARAVLNSKAA